MLGILIVGVLIIASASGLGPRLHIAAPLLLVITGLIISALPFVPEVEIDPQIILVGILPPLLYSSAVALPAIEFRRDFTPIAGLAVVLVVLTSLGLGFFFLAVMPEMGFFMAFALGAILSPTDAVATAIVKRFGISRRVVTMLEGESLLNDATALVLFRTSLVAAAQGTATFGEFGLSFVWGVVAAVIVGLGVGWLNLRFRAWVHDSAANAAVGLVVPFAAYLPTDQLGGSGLVAAVVAGIVTGQGSQRWFTPEQRVTERHNWRTIELVLEGAVFLVMGLELNSTWRSHLEDGHGPLHAAWLALVALAIVLGVRAAYVTVVVWHQGRRARRLGRMADDDSRLFADRPPGVIQHVPGLRGRSADWWEHRVRRTLADLDYYRASPLGWKHGTIIVWAGMRGAVTLAAAQTLPRDTADRDLLILTAFLVAVISLLGQGFTLPVVVRALRLPSSTADAFTREERERLEAELREAALDGIRADPPLRADGSPVPDEVIAPMLARVAALEDDDDGESGRDRLRVRLRLIVLMRSRLETLRAIGTYSSAALRSALVQLDAEEISLRLLLDEE